MKKLLKNKKFEEEKFFRKEFTVFVNDWEINFSEKVNSCEARREATLGYKEIRSFSEVL